MPVFPRPGIRNPYVPGASGAVAPVPPPQPPANYQSYGGGAPSPESFAPAPAPAQEEAWYPNPGDWWMPDDGPGFRWEPVTGQWLPPNFFSDLNDYGPGEEGNAWGAPPPWGAPASAAPVVPAKPKAPLNLPLPQTSPFLEFTDQTLGYAPTEVQNYMPSFLQGLGFQGVGNVGQYGERTYKRPNADPFAFNEQDFASIADSTIRGWLRYFLEGGQLPTS